MTLKASEFIRRFLLHVLPTGFVRIRHFGFLANRVRRDKLARCRALLELETTPEPIAPESAAAPQATVDAQAVMTTCPSCGVGRMVTVATLKAIPLDQRRCAPILQPIAFDTS